MFAMFGATVLVPILVNSYGLPLNIQTTLFFAGLGTLFFHVCTKMKVPAFLGSSFAFLGGFEAVANLSSGKYADMAASEKLQYACGGIVIAGLLYVVLAAIIKAVGVKKVMRFLPPVVTGPIIILIGLNLAPSAVNNAKTCWWLALVAMAIIIVANIWGRHRPGLQRRSGHRCSPDGLLRLGWNRYRGAAALPYRLRRLRGQV